MLQVSTIEYRKNIYKYLKLLPIQVVSRGKTQFYVVKRIKKQKVDPDIQRKVHFEAKKVDEIPNETPKETPKRVVVPSKRGDTPIRTENVAMFCRKHRAARIGDHYTCGCKI